MSLDSRDLRVGAAYERARAEARSDAIELRRRRRVDLGDLISVVFESRATLAAAAEEALRSERIEDLERVDEEAGRFGVLLPAAGGLRSALRAAGCPRDGTAGKAYPERGAMPVGSP